MKTDSLLWTQILNRVCTKCGRKCADHAEEPPYDCEDSNCDAFSDIPDTTKEVQP